MSATFQPWRDRADAATQRAAARALRPRPARRRSGWHTIARRRRVGSRRARGTSRRGVDRRDTVVPGIPGAPDRAVTEIYSCAAEGLVLWVLTWLCLIGLLAAGFTLSSVTGPIACAVATPAAAALGTALIGKLLPYSPTTAAEARVFGLYIVSGAAVAATFGGRGRRWRWTGFLLLVDAARLVDVVL